MYAITDGVILSMKGKDCGRTCNLVDPSAALRIGGEQLPMNTETNAGDDMYEPINGVNILNTLTAGETDGSKTILDESDMLTSLMYKHNFS